jgi:hypothetical protein
VVAFPRHLALTTTTNHSLYPHPQPYPHDQIRSNQIPAAHLLDKSRRCSKSCSVFPALSLYLAAEPVLQTCVAPASSFFLHSQAIIATPEYSRLSHTIHPLGPSTSTRREYKVACPCCFTCHLQTHLLCLSPTDTSSLPHIQHAAETLSQQKSICHKLKTSDTAHHTWTTQRRTRQVTAPSTWLPPNPGFDPQYK